MYAIGFLFNKSLRNEDYKFVLLSLAINNTQKPMTSYEKNAHHF